MGSNIIAARRRDAGTADILDSFRRIVGALRRSAVAAERRVGISGAQLFVLETLADGAPRSVNDLAARTLTHQSSVSVVVRRLAERGLVRRVADPADGRRRIVTVTPAGRALLWRAPVPPQGRLIDALRRLDRGEHTRLARTLRGLVRRLGVGARPATLFFEEEQHPPRAARRASAPRRRSP